MTTANSRARKSTPSLRHISQYVKGDQPPAEGPEVESAEDFPEVEVGQGISVQLMWVTPELARRWLTLLHKHQRNVRARHVDAIARDIEQGRWQLNGEPFIFDAEGRFTNGRHRATAVIQTGKPIPALVVRNVSTDAYTSMDGGSRRTSADALKSLEKSHAHILAGAARMLVRYERKKLKGQGSVDHIEVSPSETAAVIAQHSGLEEAAALAAALTRVVGRPSPMAFCFYILMAIDAKDFRAFYEGLLTGANLDRNSPVLRLRDRLLSDQPYSSDDVPFFVFKSWNAFRSCKQIGTLKVSHAERLPTPR